MAEFYIDEVATRTGLTARTLRFWEEKGLLPPPARTEGGLRTYSEADVARVERIRDLRDVLGLSLDVIRELLATEDEIDRLRSQLKGGLAPAERLPLLHRAEAVLAQQVQMMAERAARLQELQSGYEQQLERLRQRIRALESEGGGP